MNCFRNFLLTIIYLTKKGPKTFRSFSFCLFALCASMKVYCSYQREKWMWDLCMYWENLPYLFSHKMLFLQTTLNLWHVTLQFDFIVWQHMFIWQQRTFSRIVNCNTTFITISLSVVTTALEKLDFTAKTHYNLHFSHQTATRAPQTTSGGYTFFWQFEEINALISWVLGDHPSEIIVVIFLLSLLLWA